MCTNEENNEITLVIPKSINGSTYHDDNIGFTSGSSGWRSSASERYYEGMKKAFLFHDMVSKGQIKLSEDEEIKIISHSQGCAHSAGFASALSLFKNDEGKKLYNITVIEYITPHQPLDIKHPSGILGIQFSHPHDAVASDSPSWLPNGGTSYGKIPGVDIFFGQDIFGGEKQPKNTGITGNMGGHKVTDNDEFIKFINNGQVW